MTVILVTLFFLVMILVGLARTRIQHTRADRRQLKVVHRRGAK